MFNRHTGKKELAAGEVMGAERVLNHLMELRKTDQQNAWLETLIHASAKHASENRSRFMKRFGEFPVLPEEIQ